MIILNIPGYEGMVKETATGVAVNYTLAGRYLAERVLMSVTVQDTIWYYHNGIYYRDQGYVDREIVRFLNELGAGAVGTTTAARELKAQIKTYNWYNDSPLGAFEGVIPVANGVVSLLDGEPRLESYSHDWRFNYRLNVDYDPDASTEEVEEILAQWMDGEAARCLIQIPALAIMQSWGKVYKVAYLIEGQRDAGKSTYCDLVMDFVGTDNFSMADLAELTTNRFAKASLEGSIINIQDDLPSVPLSQLGRFKDLTGKARHEVERKGAQAYNAKITALHLYTCNNPPKIKEDTIGDEAFWSRWVYLNFTNHFDKDPAMAERIRRPEIRSALLNLVIAEIQKIREDPGRVYRMDPDDVRGLWNMASDHVVQYVELFYDRSPWGSIPKDEFYEDYATYCVDSGHAPLEKAKLTTALSRLGVAAYRPRTGNKRTQSYKGLVKRGEVSQTTNDHSLTDYAARRELELERAVRDAYPDDPLFAGPLMVSDGNGDYVEIRED